mgnify:CR=1 FL=1
MKNKEVYAYSKVISKLLRRDKNGNAKTIRRLIRTMRCDGMITKGQYRYLLGVVIKNVHSDEYYQICAKTIIVVY